MTATLRGIKVGSREGRIDAESEREYKVTYIVTTDNKDDGVEVVRNCSGIPEQGAAYAPGNDSDTAAIVTNKEVVETDSPFVWEVDVTYDTNVTQDMAAFSVENPLDNPVEIKYGFQRRRILIPGRFNDPNNVLPGADYNSGIFNSAGEPFEPQPEMDIDEPVLTLTKNVLTIDAQELMAIANCVNSNSFRGASSRTLRMNSPEATSRFHRSIGTYWNVTYSMAYRYDTWDVQILNQGTKYLLASALTPFTDAQGYARIGLLTTAGGALNSSSTATLGRYVSGLASPTYQRLRVYRELDFNTLGI